MAETEVVEAPEAEAPAAPATEERSIIATEPAPTDWRAGLAPELRAEKSLESFKDVNALAKSFVETKRMVGKPFEVPPADAKPEQLAEYRRRAGIPESADKYDVKLPEAPKDSGMEVDKNLLTAFLGKMHAAHARPEVVQAALDVYAQHMHQWWDRARNAENKEQHEASAETIAQLEKVWGPKDGPRWKHHLSRADAALRTIMQDAPVSAVQRIVDLINEDAELAHAFSLAADGLIETGKLDDSDVPHFDAESVAREIERTRAEMATTNPGSRRYTELKESLDRLYQQRYGRG